MPSLNKTKNCVCANKKVTHFFIKKIMYVQMDEKKKQLDEEKERRRSI